MKRNAHVCISAVSKKDEILEFRDAGLYGGLEEFLDTSHTEKREQEEIIKVQGKTLASILKAFNAPKIIDFISIDVEGGEREVLEQLVSMKDYFFKCGCIEHNFRKDDLEFFKDLLLSSNYKIAWKDQTEHDLFFINSEII